MSPISLLRRKSPRMTFELFYCFSIDFLLCFYCIFIHVGYQSYFVFIIFINTVSFISHHLASLIIIIMQGFVYHTCTSSINIQVFLIFKLLVFLTRISLSVSSFYALTRVRHWTNSTNPQKKMKICEERNQLNSVRGSDDHN